MPKKQPQETRKKKYFLPNAIKNSVKCIRKRSQYLAFEIKEFA